MKACDILFLVGPALAIIGGAFAGYRSQKTKKLSYFIKPAIFSIVVPLIVAIILSFSYWGDGWILEDNYLEIKAPPIYDTIDIFAAEAMLIDSSNPLWQTAGRTNAVGLPKLSIGRHRISNGKSAIVFRHMNSDKTIVIKSDEQYFLIAHPGVEVLYQEMVERGVAESDL